ncbi:MAG: hypothetical protein HQM16_04345 [Deltaproteobacteria bacterium]|nr:hypothetical protein [Deltaproteobacteria bacterium]
MAAGTISTGNGLSNNFLAAQQWAQRGLQLGPRGLPYGTQPQAQRGMQGQTGKPWGKNDFRQALDIPHRRLKARSPAAQRYQAPAVMPHFSQRAETGAATARTNTQGPSLAGLTAVTLLATALTFATANPAHALEIPPFQEGVRVYTQPAGYKEVPLTQVKKATTSAGYDIYVVVYKGIDYTDRDLNKGYKPDKLQDPRTEKAGYQIQITWAQDPKFNSPESMIIVMDNNRSGVDYRQHTQGRQISITPGTTLDQTYGFNKTNRDRLGQIIDKYFMQTALDTGDMDAALANLVKGIDKELDGIIDPPRNLLARLNTSIGQAEQVLQSSELTEKDNPDGLRKAYDLARAIRDHEPLMMFEAKDALEKLNNKLEKVGEEIAKREGLKRDLEGAISEAEAVLKQPGILATDNTALIETNIANARDRLAGRDYDAIESMTKHLVKVTQALSAQIKQRSEARALLSDIIKRAETAETNFGKMRDERPGDPKSRDMAAEANVALGTNDYNRINAIRSALERLVAEDEAVIANWQLEQNTKAAIMALMALGTLLSMGGLGVWLGRRAGKYNAKKAAFDAKIKEWEEKIGQAWQTYYDVVEGNQEGKMLDLVGMNGQLLHEVNLARPIKEALSNTEGDTKLLYDKFKALATQMANGVHLIDEHVKVAKSLGDATDWSQKGGLEKLEEAFNRLSRLDNDTAVKLDTAGRPEHQAQADADTTINPQAFWNEFEADRDELKSIWTQLTDALKATNRKAEDDLPLTHYNELIEELSRAGLNPDWLKTHPLRDAAKKWEELNVVRRKDPINYVRTISENLKAQEELAGVLSTIMYEVSETHQSKITANSININYDGIVLTPENDPRVAEKEAEAKMEALNALLEQADINQAEAIIAMANEAEQAYDRVEDLKNNILVTISASVEGLDRAKTMAAHYRDALTKAKERAAALSLHHDEPSLTRARIEIKEAEDDLALASAALSEAERLFKANDHFAALAKSKEAQEYIKSGLVDVKEMHTEVDRLETVRSEYATYYTSLADGTQRRHMVGKMAAYAPYNDAGLFEKGDTHLRENILSPNAITSATNWQTQLDNARRTEALWERAVEIAKKTKAVHTTDDKVNSAEQKLSEAIDRVNAIEPFHGPDAIKKAWQEVDEAKAVVKKADTARDKAMALVGQGSVEAAHENSATATKLYTQAVKEIQDIIDECNRLEEARRNYEKRYAEMMDYRRARLDEMRGFGSYGSTDRLGSGNRYFDPLPLPTHAREVNYYLLLQSLDNAHSHWNTGYERARREYREYQAALEAERQRQLAEERRRVRERQEREAREAERQAAARRARASSYSYSSGSGRSGGGGMSGFGGGSRGGSRSISIGGGGSRGGSRGGF